MKPVCIILLSVLYFEAASQLILTRQFNQPAPGDQFVYFPQHSGDSASLPRNTGTDQLWNFTGMHSPPFGYTVTETYSLASISGSTLVSRTPATNVVELFNIPSFPDAFEFSKIISGGDTVVNFTNPKRLFQYPFTYGDSFTDSYFANLKYSSSSSGTWRGVVTMSATGTGTLILPDRQLSGVLQLKMVQHDTTTNVSATAYTAVKYLYFHASSKEPVLTVNYGKGKFTEALVSKSFFSGFSEHTAASDWTIYPNPAHDKINIRSESNSGRAIHLSLYNSVGQQVMDGEYLRSSPVVLDRGNLPAGLYTLSITENDSNRSFRIIITDK